MNLVDQYVSKLLIAFPSFTIFVIHFQLCEEHEAKMKKLEELQERAEQLERRRETLERNKKIAEQSRKVREELLNREKSESSESRDSEIK